MIERDETYMWPSSDEESFSTVLVMTLKEVIWKI